MNLPPSSRVLVAWRVGQNSRGFQIDHSSRGYLDQTEFPVKIGVLAPIRALRLCGEKYKKRVNIAATIRAQNVIEERKLETKEKLNAQKNLEKLSTASIE